MYVYMCVFALRHAVLIVQSIRKTYEQIVKRLKEGLMCVYMCVLLHDAMLL